MSNIIENQVNKFLLNNYKNISKLELQIEENKKLTDNNFLELTKKYSNLNKINNEDCSLFSSQIINNNQALISNNRNITNIDNNIKTLIKLFNSLSLTLNILDKIVIILKLLPAPATFATVGVIVTFGDTLSKTTDKINKIRTIIDNVLPFLNDLNALLVALNAKLSDTQSNIINSKNFMDERNPPCSNFKSIKLEANIFSSSKSDNIIGYYKGFTFVLKEENNKNFQIGDIKRKYAIALDNGGNFVLESEHSFASDPEILIEELKFKIDQNNLKP